MVIRRGCCHTKCDGWKLLLTIIVRCVYNTCGTTPKSNKRLFPVAIFLFMYLHDADGNLFHRVILQSGSALNPWAVASRPETYFRQLSIKSAAMFNCTQLRTSSHQQQQQEDDDELLVECLRQVPVDRLISIDLPALRYRSTVGPVLNGDVLPSGDVRHLMMQQDSPTPWSRLNVLLGFVSNEGILLHFRQGGPKWAGSYEIYCRDLFLQKKMYLICDFIEMLL